MKSVFLLLVSTVFCIIANAETSPATSYAGGSGTSGDPYQIATLAQLRKLSETSSDWSSSYYYILTADIDATDTKTWNSGEGFSPIGNSSTSFAACFDGQNHTISNLYINRPSQGYVGFFGELGYPDYLWVRNLGLLNVDITGGSSYTGGMVGYNHNCSITNCYVTGKVTGASSVGGLAGITSGYSQLDKSYSTANVTGTTNVGGLCGHFYSNTADMNNSYASGNVSGTTNVGGFAGAISGSSSYGDLVIINCFSTGTVTGTTSVGGFLGNCSSSDAKIENCYVTSENTSSSIPRFVGAYNAALTNCYFQKLSTSDVAIGTNSSGQTVTGLATADFALQNTFTNWDFPGNWVITTITDIDPNPRPYLSNFIDKTIYTTIFTAKDGGGYLSGENPQYIVEGDNSRSVTAIAASGFKFVEWRDVSGAIYSTENPLTCTNVTSDISLEAVFVLNNNSFTGAFSLYPVKDAYIYWKSNYSDRAETNYGNSSCLDILDSEYPSRDYCQGLIHFSGIQKALDSLGVTDVTAALKYVKLMLFHYPESSSGHTGENAFSLYWYNKDWSETEVTWNNAPALDDQASYVTVAKSSSTVQDYSIDITDIFTSNYSTSSGSAGFRLQLNNGVSGTRQEVMLTSKDYSNSSYFPYLQFTFEDFSDVNFNTDGNGTISGNVSQTIPSGSDATTVTAVANEGYQFLEWRNASGDSITNVNPLTVSIVTQDSTLTAIFDLIHYTISFSAGENGSIAPLGDSSITTNETIHCTITPNTGYVVDNVTYNGVSIVGDLTENSNGSYSYDISSVSADATIEATFKEYVEYTITASSGDHGSISPEGAITVTSSVKTFEFTPDEGYVVSQVVLDGNTIPVTGNSYTLNNIDANHTLYVEFEEFKGILSFYPERDAHIYENGSNSDRANTNYGEMEVIIIKCEGSYENYWNTLIHFSGIQELLTSTNISDLADTIESVKLKLYHKPGGTGHTGDNAFNVYWYNKDWGETTVTWNNAPALDEDTVFVSVPASSSNFQDYVIDITDMFLSQYQEADGEAGFKLEFVENINNKSVILASKEYVEPEYAPSLRIYVKGYDFTDVNTVTYESLSIYPNPTTGVVNIPLESGVSNANISVYNITGSLVYTDVTFKGGAVDLSFLQNGMYIVKMNINGNISQTKLVKK